jgi:hypothetical protein
MTLLEMTRLNTVFDMYETTDAAAKKAVS